MVDVQACLVLGLGFRVSFRPRHRDEGAGEFAGIDVIAADADSDDSAVSRPV
jgi:hypothetical protein